MKVQLTKLLQLLISLTLIMGSLGLGHLLQSALNTSIPASVLGMLILFIALVTGLIKLEWVNIGANLFIRYMVFLFVPISVGLMQHFEMLLENALSIFASVIGGSLFVLVTLAWGLDKLLEEEK